MIDFDDVDIVLVKQPHDLKQCTGAILQCNTQPRQPARSRQIAQQDIGQQPRVDIAAAQHHADIFPGEFFLVRHDCGKPGGTRALNNRFLDLQQQTDRGFQIRFGHQNNFVDQGGYAVWLKNIKTGMALYPTPDVSIYDAILASCAAPTYFPCHNFTVVYGKNRRKTIEYAGIDGSIFDNPCISYHGAIRQHVPPDSKLTMIILGTGHTLRSFKKDDWNSFGGLGVVDPTNDLPLINILFHASETALIESFAQEMKGNIYTFNKSLIPEIRFSGPVENVSTT